jgi:hypothetical protein
MLKWILITAAAIALLVVSALIALPWFLNTRAFQAYVSQAATHALGRHVRFASLSVSFLPLPTVRLRGLEVADDPAFGSGAFLTMREGRIGIRIRPLLSARVELADLTLEAPTIMVVEDERGRWNWASLGASAPGPAGGSRAPSRIGAAAPGTVLLSRIRITDGRLRYQKLGVKASDLTLEKIDLTMRQVAPGAGFRLQGTAVAEPGHVKLAIREASLAPAGSRSLAETALHATVEAETGDVAPLAGWLRTRFGVAGHMDGRFELTGTLSRPTATGIIRARRLILSAEQPQCNPPHRQLPLNDVHIPIAYAGTRIQSVPLEARVGKGRVALHLSVALGPPATATLTEIKATGVDAGPILIDFLCLTSGVTGPLDLAGNMRFDLDDPVRTAKGAGRLRIGPGRVSGSDIVDLIGEAAALASVASAIAEPGTGGRRVAPLEFTSITATYTIAGGVARTTDLLYEGRDLRVAGAGTLGLADGRVAMALTLTQGRNEVKALVSGTPGSLHVVPTAVRLPDARGVRKFLDQLFR